MANPSILSVVLDRKISDLETKLNRENSTIEAALEPSIVDGKPVFYSPGDGYWKKRWQLENQLRVALILRDELA